MSKMFAVFFLSLFIVIVDSQNFGSSCELIQDQLAVHNDFSESVQHVTASRACLVKRNDYFMKIIQKAVTKVETDVQWSNLKVLNLNRVINENLFKWHAQGTVNYTNGFVVAIQKIDVTNIQDGFSSRNVNGTMENLASVRGVLNFRNIKIGYDVIANLKDSGTQHFTGLYMYTTVSTQYLISKNLDTHELSVHSQLMSVQGGFRRMEYMPRNSVSEVISRDFGPALLWESFNKWSEDYINSFILEITNNTEFPKIRFDNRC